MDLKQLGQYQALTEEEYANVFSTFIAKSTEYKAMMSLIKPAIDGFGGSAVKVMSIGAGTGCVEDDLIRNYGLNMDYFYAIEPNPLHLIELKKTISGWGSKYKIDARYFDPKMEIDCTFDLIIMSHVMYYMTDPLGAMQKAKDLLNPGGCVVIFHQGEKGGNMIYVEFMKKASKEKKTMNDDVISCKELCTMLKKSGVNQQLTLGASTLEVDDFVRRRNTPTANDVISFFLQTRFENLSKELKQEVFEIVKKASYENSDGKYVLNNSTAMIQIFSGENA